MSIILTVVPMKQTPMKTASPQRLTLYVKPEHQALLHWAQTHTQASSMTEAVFQALDELRILIKERRSKALEQAHGMWKENRAIGKAFQEVEAGWEAWQRKLEGS